MSLLEESIEAHGGRNAFERLGTVGLRLQCRGPALGMKLRPAVLADVPTTVDLHEPRAGEIFVWRTYVAHLTRRPRFRPGRRA